MAKSATVKDVLYALEFAGAQLCRRPSPGGHKAAWSLEPGGVKVPAGVADQARLSPSVAAIESNRYGEVRYVWRSAA